MEHPVVGRLGPVVGLLIGLALCSLLAAPGSAGAAEPTVSAPTTTVVEGIATPGPLAVVTSSESGRGPATSSPQPTAPPEAGSGPQLSIAVDNGRKSAAPGEVLNYVLTLTNLGSADVKGLRVTQSVPSGLTLVKADGGGRVKAGNVGWNVDLRAATAATFHVTMKVSATPEDLLRLATVACASMPAATAPIVCASHSDQLPAGASAAAATPAASAAAAGGLGRAVPATASGSSPSVAGGAWWWGGAAILAVVVLVLVLALVRVRRRRSATTVAL